MWIPMFNIEYIEFNIQQFYTTDILWQLKFLLNSLMFWCWNQTFRLSWTDKELQYYFSYTQPHFCFEFFMLTMLRNVL